MRLWVMSQQRKSADLAVENVCVDGTAGLDSEGNRLAPSGPKSVNATVAKPGGDDIACPVAPSHVDVRQNLMENDGEFDPPVLDDDVFAFVVHCGYIIGGAATGRQQQKTTFNSLRGMYLRGPSRAQLARAQRLLQSDSQMRAQKRAGSPRPPPQRVAPQKTLRICLTRCSRQPRPPSRCRRLPRSGPRSGPRTCRKPSAGRPTAC